MARIPVYNIENFNFNVANSQLYVNTFNAHLEAHHFVEQPHRHNFYMLVLFTHGAGTHDIDFNPYPVTKGSLFLIRPGQVHNWKVSRESDGYIVFYSANLYNFYFGNKKIEDYPFFESMESDPHMLLTPDEVRETEGYFLKMLEESSSTRSRRTDVILNLLDTVHVALSRKYAPDDHHESHRYYHLMKKFNKLLDENFIHQRSPSYYASRMYISLKHLNRICKTVLGKTATEVIAGRVMLEAKRLLSIPGQSIAQVAHQLEFCDPAYFSKMFKKQAGVSPGSFRNSLQ